MSRLGLVMVSKYVSYAPPKNVDMSNHGTTMTATACWVSSRSSRLAMLAS